MIIIKQSSYTKKKAAREILFANYRTLLPSTLFFIAISVGFVLLFNTYCSILVGMSGMESYYTVSVTTAIVSFLLIYPFFMGYLSLFARSASGMKVSVSEMFEFFGGKRLKECYAFLLSEIPFVLLGIGLPFGGLYFAETAIDGTALNYLGKYLFIADIIVIIWGVYFIGRLMVSASDFCLGEKHKYTFSDRRRFFTELISLIPAYILAFFSFGVLFFTYALPMTVLLISIHAKSHKKDIMLSETRIFDITDKAGANTTNEIQGE